MAKNETAKICAILSYFLLGIIWYYADDKMRKNKLAGHHAKQALVLFIAYVIYQVAFGLLTLITLGLFALVGWIGFVLFFAWWVLGIYYAFTDQKEELFWIGQFAKNL